MLRSPLVLACFVGLAVSIVGFLVKAVTTAIGLSDPFSVRGFARSMASGLPFAFLALPFGGMLFWSFARSSGATKVVVWLRRFHQQEPSRFPLPKYFTMVGTGRFQVATIQDTRFKTAYITGVTRSVLAMAGIQVLLVIPFLILSLYITIKLLGFSVTPGGGAMVTALVAGVLTLVLQTAFVAPIFVFIVRRRGVVALKDGADVARATAWIDRVHSGVGHFLPGLKIFKCGDDFWEQAVAALLARCDAAIIDVSELNQNMRWELRQCLSLLGPERVIVTYGVSPDRYPDDPDEVLVKRLEAEIGRDLLEKVLFWPYPEPLPVERGKPVVDEALGAEVYVSLKLAMDHVLDDVPIEELSSQLAAVRAAFFIHDARDGSD